MVRRAAAPQAPPVALRQHTFQQLRDAEHALDSQRNKRKYEHEGRLFWAKYTYRAGNDGGKTRALCDGNSTTGCSACAIFNEDGSFDKMHAKNPAHHPDCFPRPAIINAAIVRNGIKRRAAIAPAEGPTAIQTHIGLHMDRPGLAEEAMTRLSAVRKLVKRARVPRDGAGVPVVAPAIDPLTVQIPLLLVLLPNDDYTSTSILAGSEVIPEGRVLFFSDRHDVSMWINECTEIYTDETFLPAPVGWHGVVVILGRFENFHRPIGYALLPSKSANSWACAFTLLRTTYPNLKPHWVYCDFEKAIHLAISRVFGEGTQVQGCLFHLHRSLRSALSRGGVAHRNTEAVYNLHCRMILALTMVPTEYVVDVFRQLAAHLSALHDGDDYWPALDWFDHFYMGGVLPGAQRCTPLYHRDVWHLRRRVLENRPRTNNPSEAHNLQFQKGMGSAHQTLFKFIDSLKMFLIGVRVEQTAAVNRGQAPRRRRPMYERVDENLRRIALRPWHAAQYLDYLRNVAVNFGNLGRPS